MPNVISVRKTEILRPLSFSFHLTMDTLVIRYVLPTIGQTRGFYPLDCTHAEHTTTNPQTCGLRIHIFIHFCPSPTPFDKEP